MWGKRPKGYSSFFYQSFIFTPSLLTLEPHERFPVLWSEDIWKHIVKIKGYLEAEEKHEKPVQAFCISYNFTVNWFLSFVRRLRKYYRCHHILWLVMKPLQCSEAPNLQAFLETTGKLPASKEPQKHISGLTLNSTGVEPPSIRWCPTNGPGIVARTVRNCILLENLQRQSIPLLLLAHWEKLN